MLKRLNTASCGGTFGRGLKILLGMMPQPETDHLLLQHPLRNFLHRSIEEIGGIGARLGSIDTDQTCGNMYFRSIFFSI
jgi:hypothetical protein